MVYKQCSHAVSALSHYFCECNIRTSSLKPKQIEYVLCNSVILLKAGCLTSFGPIFCQLGGLKICTLVQPQSEKETRQKGYRERGGEKGYVCMGWDVYVSSIKCSHKICEETSMLTHYSSLLCLIHII